MIELTTDQEKHAVTLFAQGYSRSEVVSDMIDNDEEIREQLKLSGDESEFRKKLSDKLMSCDPGSTRFAITKHKEHYESHRKALSKSLSNTYENMIIRSVENIRKSIEETREMIQDIKHNLENALETIPVGASEYMSMANTHMNLKKREMELEDKLLERLERIHQKTIEF